MGYTIYERQNIRTGEAAVSITTAGRFAINAAATRALHKNGVEAVLLMSDRDRRKIAFKPISKKDKRAFMIAYGKNFGGSSMSAKGFLDDLGWDGKKYTIPGIWNEDQSLFELDLPEWSRDAKQKMVGVEHARRHHPKAV